MGVESYGRPGAHGIAARNGPELDLRNGDGNIAPQGKLLGGSGGDPFGVLSPAPPPPSTAALEEDAPPTPPSVDRSSCTFPEFDGACVPVCSFLRRPEPLPLLLVLSPLMWCRRGVERLYDGIPP